MRPSYTIFITLVLILVVLLGWGSYTYTPAISSSQGIASLERVKINGSDQWILVRGEDLNKPLLLWIHGGHGQAMIIWARRWLSPLEKDFIVVSWDQRGAGKSFSPDIPPDSMTYDQFTSDIEEPWPPT